MSFGRNENEKGILYLCSTDLNNRILLWASGQHWKKAMIEEMEATCRTTLGNWSRYQEANVRLAAGGYIPWNTKLMALSRGLVLWRKVSHKPMVWHRLSRDVCSCGQTKRNSIRVYLFIYYHKRKQLQLRDLAYCISNYIIRRRQKKRPFFFLR